MTPEHREEIWKRLGPSVPGIARERRQRRTMTLATVAAAGAALCAATVVGALAARRESAPAFPMALTAGAEVRVGESVVTLARGGEARAVAADSVVLVAGVLGVHAGAPFSIETSEARVEVLGTRFTVARAQGRTTVDVSEGRVAVTATAGRRERRVVRAGERAMVPEPPRAPIPSPITTPNPTPRPGLTPAPAPAPTPSLPPTPSTPPLDLMADADAARDAGDLPRALDLYVRAARAGPVVRRENALVIAARVAEKLGRIDRAVEIWRAAASAHGAHHEQALVGLVRNLRALGRTSEARAAAEELVETHPGSPGAREATRMLPSE
ncbi:MAG: FecR domain-containing protein [Myxococcota bacterium]